MGDRAGWCGQKEGDEAGQTAGRAGPCEGPEQPQLLLNGARPEAPGRQLLSWELAGSLEPRASAQPLPSGEADPGPGPEPDRQGAGAEAGGPRTQALALRCLQVGRGVRGEAAAAGARERAPGGEGRPVPPRPTFPHPPPAARRQCRSRRVCRLSPNRRRPRRLTPARRSWP